MYRRMMRTGLVAMGLAVAGASAAQGYGPGMRGGGYGPGGDGYVPGMMGYGPGMMGGYGPGRGAGGVTSALNLTDEQREKIYGLLEQNRQKNWDRMGKMRAEQFKLRSLYNADDVDPKAFAEQHRKVDELRREMLVSRLEMRKQLEGVLTPEQRRRSREMGPRWLEEGELE